MVRIARFKQGVNVCFTLFNYTQETIRRLQTLPTPMCIPEWIGYVTYIVFQRELASTTEAMHLQGYMELSRKCKLNTVKAIIGDNTVHLETRLGTQAQAIAYCKKESTREPGVAPIESGNPRVDRRRTDERFEISASNIDLSISDLNELHPLEMIKHSSGVKTLRDTLMEHRSSIPEILILYGPSGCGKTQLIKNTVPDAYFIPKPTGGRWWWAGYDYQETVVFDDFRHHLLDYMTFLSFLSSDPMTVEFKGGNIKMTSTSIIISTNVDPRNWYKGVKRYALFRRLHQFATIFEFSWNNPIQRWFAEEQPNGQPMYAPNSTYAIRDISARELEAIGREDAEWDIQHAQRQADLQQGRDFTRPTTIPTDQSMAYNQEY